MRGVAAVVSVPCRGGCPVHFTGWVSESGIDLIFGHRVLGKGDGLAIQPDETAIIATACVIVRGQIMGQINHEAGIAACGAFAHAQGVEDKDVEGCVQLLEAAGCRKARKTCADDGDVCVGFGG